MTTMFTVVKTADAIVAEGMMQLPIARTDGKKGKSGHCIVVPAVSDSLLTLVQSSEIGKQYIVDCINDVRSKIASSINKAGNTITSDKLGIDAILEAMKIASESQRMTKEAIGNWFDSDAASIVETLASAKGMDAGKIKQLQDAFKAQFQTLAGREPSMTAAIKLQLQKVIAEFPEDYDSVIGCKVIEALDKVQEPASILEAL